MRAIGMYIFGGSQTIGHLQSGWEVNTILEMTDTMLDENDPGMNKKYRDIPYFKYVDVEKVASAILNADNRTRKAFYSFLDHRYGFSAKYVLSEELKAESDKLEEIKHILNESIDGKELVDKRLINMIITAIIKILTQK